MYACPTCRGRVISFSAVHLSRRGESLITCPSCGATCRRDVRRVFMYVSVLASAYVVLFLAAYLTTFRLETPLPWILDNYTWAIPLAGGLFLGILLGVVYLSLWRTPLRKVDR